MMKISLFLLVLVAGSLAQNSNNNNDNCAFNLGAPGGACFSNNDCASGLSCASGLCQFINLGTSCTADSQCGGLYPFCIGGRCDAKRIPGDPCTSSAQCISGSCSGTCLSRQLNEACGGSDCAPGLFCSPLTRVCSSKLAVGASCGNLYVAMVSNISFAHDLTVMCSDSALCDYNSNTGSGTASTGFCTPIFSSTQSCGAFGSFTCPIGSTCNGGSCASINNNNNNNNNNSCGGSLQCGGITTFCGCSGNNNNFQVYGLPQTSVTVPAAGGSNQGASAGASVSGTQVTANTASGATVQGTQVSAGAIRQVVSAQGATVSAQGASVGTGQTGASVGTQGASVGTGQTGASVGTQGASVGSGQTGAAVSGTQVTANTASGATVTGTQVTGTTVGTTVPVTGTTVVINTNVNNNGQCTTDQCLGTFAPDYYSCLLQNGCGLATEPIFIDGTCASNCAFLYSRIKCCQAGFQPIVSQSGNTGNNNNGNNNSGSNSLQRSVVLPPQVQCVSFTQTQVQSSAASLEVGILVAASLLAAFVF